MFGLLLVLFVAIPAAELYVILQVGHQSRDHGRRQVQLTRRRGKSACVDDPGKDPHGVQSIQFKPQTISVSAMQD